ncbi:Protein of unknown function [Bacillus mobilis]|nr:Protein of unknown function [Bacillus mobilis]
MEMNRV